MDDKNDNGPVLQTTQNVIEISDGRILKPFLIKVILLFISEISVRKLAAYLLAKIGFA